MSDSVIYKPQVPITNQKGDKILPLTSADQVTMKDGSRLNTKIISVDLDGVYTDSTAPINADTLGGYTADKFIIADDAVDVTVLSTNADFLGGHPASYYTTMGDVTELINKRIDAIGSSDMAKSTYDKNDSGVVDDAERLGGQLPEYYATAEELAGKLGNSGAQEIIDGSLKITSTGNTALRLDKTIDDSNYVREYFILESDRARAGFGINGSVANQMSLYEDRTEFTKPVTIASGGTGATTVDGILSNLGIEAGANKYTHPSYTSKNSGFYKVTVDGTGHVSATTAVTKSDITGLGIHAQDTVYTHPSYTARTGKPTANQSPAFGSTVTISQMTSDATGHVTGATDRTITIPSTLSNGTGPAGLIKTSSTVTSNSGYTACPVINGVPYYKDTDTDTNTKVTQTLVSANNKYPLLLAPTGQTTTTTTTACFDAGVTLNPSTNSLTIENGDLKITNSSEPAIRLDMPTDDSGNYIRQYMILGSDRARVGFGANGTISNQLSLYTDKTVFTQPVTVASGGTGAATASAARDNLGITELLAAKQDKITGAASSIVSSDFSNTNVVLVSNSSGKVSSVSGVTTTELQTLQGVTKNLATAMTSLGTNVIDSSDNDTPAKWVELGSGYAYFSATGRLVNQPAQYGIVVSNIVGSMTFQFFAVNSSTGSVYVRYGNSNGWRYNWSKITDDRKFEFDAATATLNITL